MGKKANVFVREEGIKKEVLINDDFLPEINTEIIEKWQRIINIMASILKVPAGLIMQITQESMVVFLKSQNSENPYPVGGSDKLGHGLYCETVIGRDEELLVKNAIENEKWKDNPDVKLNMISYYGLPIHWPNNDFFGTICVLDNKENAFSDEYQKLLKEFKEAIETDLKMLIYEEKLKYYADIDILTSSYNRNKIEKELRKQFNYCKDKGCTFSVAIMDINQLKRINDENGHVIGDKVIKTFADGFRTRISKECSFGRWGGDEFVLVCPNCDLATTNRKLREIFEKVSKEMKSIINYASYCYGCAEFDKNDESYEKLLNRADDDLYIWKKTLKK